MENYIYKLEYGTWFFYADGRMKSGTDDLVFAYDPESFTMLKHGDKLGVEAWANTFRGKGLSIDLLILSKETPVEEVNKMIHISGYIELFLKKYSNPLTQ